ncbi:unnamed protein product [Strongylus vulgaris]|uniref:Rho-GAP domain-containing protein n=1 Tax=Strongylus vulgaris TaxID=40348 RepID=A0A3P7IWC8_STRVU|nr:unnamed protein product [Strongylus vulgaris]
MCCFRAKFDRGNEPDLFEFGQRDIYSVSSLLKQYFRQLPNPLFTFQSYSRILVCLKHYRTAAYLMRHLSRLCSYTSLTDMTAKNLAIVWAPNLFRAPPVLAGGDSHLLNGLDIHTSLCSFLITNSESIFVEDNADPVHSSGDSFLFSSIAHSHQCIVPIRILCRIFSHLNLQELLRKRMSVKEPLI